MNREERFRLMVHYVRERQAIWIRRERGDPPPWTEDPFLANVRFTNVFRHLDPGTRFVTGELFDRGRAEPWTHLAWNLLVYRLVGTIASARAGGWIDPSKPWDRAGWVERLRALDRSGVRPFTAAYMVASYGAEGGEDKIESLSFLFGRHLERWSETEAAMVAAPGREELHAVFEGLRGWGGFLAFQALVDLAYLNDREIAPSPAYRVPTAGTNDGWVYLGTGAKLGLAFLEGERIPKHRWPEAMTSLRDELNSALRREGFRGPRGRDELDLANTANCLCEYSKYWRLRFEDGKPKRRFDPAGAWEHGKWAKGHGRQIDLLSDLVPAIPAPPPPVEAQPSLFGDGER